MRRQALIAGLTSALVASLIAVAPSSANDLRSPDARDAADAVVVEHTAQSDLRSPDTRNVADATTEGALAQERYYASYGTPEPPRTQVPVARPQSHFDWAPIGIGGGLLALCIVGVGVAVRSRRTVPAVTR